MLCTHCLTPIIHNPHTGGWFTVGQPTSILSPCATRPHAPIQA